jgi:uncharacterized protein (TIGR03067 family)
MRRRSFLAAGAAALAPFVVRPTAALFAQDTPNAAATKPASHLPSTKPTPPDKIKQLKAIPAKVAASAQYWQYREEIDGAPVNGEIAGLADGVVTLFDRDGHRDVVVAELTDENQAAIARFRRLLENKDVGDERKLLGSWKVVPPKAPEPVSFVQGAERFTINSLQLCLNGENMPYLVDAMKSPRQIDVYEYKGIYELDGDELRICLNTRSDVRPAKVELRDGHALVIGRRLPDVSSLLVPTAEQYDPELKSFCEELARLLEADDFAGFLKRSIAPKFVAEIPPERLTKMQAAMAVHKEIGLAGVRAMLRVVPKLKSGGHIAEFDFSEVHADGIRPITTVAAMKVDGRWYSKP